MSEEIEKDEWCCWTLSVEDIKVIASLMGVLVDKEDFDEIARLTKKGIAWALDDIWEEVVRNAIRDALEDKEKQRKFNVGSVEITGVDVDIYDNNTKEVKLSEHKTIKWDGNDYETLLKGVGTLETGDRIYVGDLGYASVTEYDNPLGITVYLVDEEDNTISWQLIVDEHSDYVITEIKVIPDEPVKE